MDTIKTITTEELEKKLNNQEKLELVDVREDEEVAEGIINLGGRSCGDFT